MGKLTSIKPLLASARPVLGRISDRYGHSAINEPWRAWYNLKRWRGTRDGDWLDGMRGHVLIRDNFICQHDGCGKRIDNPKLAVAHHVRAHRGDPALFWDPGNLVCVCKECHDGPIAAEEARQRAAGLL